MINDIDEMLCMLKDNYNNGFLEPERVLQIIISKIVISSSNVEQLNSKHEWLHDVLIQSTGTKIKTHDEKLDIGDFVECLIKYGSSRMQAIEATAQWLGISYTKVRQANEFSRKNFRKKTKITTKIQNNYVCQFVESQMKPFPVDYPKALNAFNEFQERMSENKLIA